MSNPLSKFSDFFRRQFGSPDAELERAIEGFEEHVEQRIHDAVAPLVARIVALEGGAPASADTGDAGDALTEIRAQVASLRTDLDKLQSASATDITADFEALHKRLAAVEAAAKPAAAPARAAAPAARATTA